MTLIEENNYIKNDILKEIQGFNENIIHMPQEYEQKVNEISVELKNIIENKLCLILFKEIPYEGLVIQAIGDIKEQAFPLDITKIKTQIIDQCIIDQKQYLNSQLKSYMKNDELIALEWLKMIEPFFQQYKNQKTNKIMDFKGLQNMYFDILDVFNNLMLDKTQDEKIQQELNNTLHEIYQIMNENGQGISLFDNLQIFNEFTLFQEQILTTNSSQKKVLIIGLDASGKTFLLYKLKLGENINTIPTIGFNVEEVKIKRSNLQIWDIGGSAKIRILWRHYYENLQGIMYLVSLQDKERFEESIELLQQQLENGLKQNKNLYIQIIGNSNSKANYNQISFQELQENFQFLDEINIKWSVKIIDIQNESQQEIMDKLLDFNKNMK